MDSPCLPLWTLSLRLDGDVLECSLGDGRRLACRANRPASVLEGCAPQSLAQVIGDDLAHRLARSDPRPLIVLYDGHGPLDPVDWENLTLGSLRLAQHFAFARQLVVDDIEPGPLPTTHAAASLTSLCLCRDVATPPPAWLRPVRRIALDVEPEHSLVAEADVVILDGIGLQEFLDGVAATSRRRLLVVRDSPEPGHLIAALDAGAVVWAIPPPLALHPDAMTTVLRLLDAGQAIGDALRVLHRRATAEPLRARLYGDPELRFVRPVAPATRRQITSLSFDMVGSTELMRTMGDEAYADTLAVLHRRSADLIRRHGGQPDDPQGDDGVMGYFGHPAAIEHAAVRAVEAAVAIVDAATELGVQVRVGVATGAVAIKAGQPVGLSIHLAARLQQAAAAGTVLVSDATRRLVRHAFDLHARTDMPALKGVEDQVAYLVIGRCSDGRQPRGDGQTMPFPLVGRARELGRLAAQWQDVVRGACRAIVIGAEAGYGKSRLVREFRQQLAESGQRVLEIRCRADAMASPFLTLAESLRRSLDIDVKPAHAPAQARLSAALPEHARRGVPLALLADLLGIAHQPPLVTTAGSRPQIRGLLIDWLRHFSGPLPCCLIVEDWHWIDPSTREFIEHLLRPPSDLRLLVVITTRIEGLSSARAVASADAHIELPPLTSDEARELVGRICADRQVSERLMQQLAERGDGVPLFIEEAARLAVETGSDSAETERRAVRGVPASLQDLLMARLDAVGPAKPVAQVAAVLGRSFSRALLRALLDGTPHALDLTTLDERLDTLRTSGLIRGDGDERLVFRHALIRDAAYASLWARERQDLHARVVELLQQRWPELAAQQPELLAHHQTEAGLHAQALAQWELAARHATARSAELEAISHLRRALALIVQAPAGEDRDRRALRLQLLLAARLLATEGYGADAVHAAYLEAQRLCDGIGDPTALFKIEMGLEAYRFMRAEFVPALEHGRRAADIALASTDLKQRLHAHWGLACTLFHQGELPAAMREMDTALELYSPSMHAQFGIQDPGVMCMAYSSWGLWEIGRPDASLARIQRAVRMADEFRHRFSQAVAMAYAVSIELLRGEADAALQRADGCAHLCETYGFPVWLAITRCMRGYLLCTRGEFDDGLREMSAGYAHWLGTGARVSQPLYLALQVEGLLLAGQVQAASDKVDEGLAIIERYGERQLEAELYRLRGEIAFRRGDRADGEAWLRRSYIRALRRRRLGFALRSATALARHWAEDGRAARARRLLAPLLARWTEGHGTRDVSAAATLLASLD